MKLKDLIFENKELLKDITPAQAAAIHKFLKSRLLHPALDAKLRMSIFEQEFPLGSSLYDEFQKASGATNEVNVNESTKSLSLKELTWEVLTSVLGKVPMFGFHLPHPDDSYRMANNQEAFEDWKKGTMNKYGDINIKLDSEAANPSERVQVLDDKFIADKKRRVAGKAAWLDKEREAGRSTD